MIFNYLAHLQLQIFAQLHTKLAKFGWQIAKFAQLHTKLAQIAQFAQLHTKLAKFGWQIACKILATSKNF